MAISLQFSRISTRTDLSVPDIKVFRCRKPLSVRCSAGEVTPASSSMSVDFDAKVFRKNLTRSENYNRKGFGRKEETMELMNREFTSKLLLNCLINLISSHSFALTYMFCFAAREKVRLILLELIITQLKFY